MALFVFFVVLLFLFVCGSSTSSLSCFSNCNQCIVSSPSVTLSASISWVSDCPSLNLTFFPPVDEYRDSLPCFSFSLDGFLSPESLQSPCCTVLFQNSSFVEVVQCDLSGSSVLGVFGSFECKSFVSIDEEYFISLQDLATNLFLFLIWCFDEIALFTQFVLFLIKSRLMVEKADSTFVIFLFNKPNATSCFIFQNQVDICTIKQSFIDSLDGLKEEFFYFSFLDGRICEDSDIISSSCTLIVNFRGPGGGKKKNDSDEEFDPDSNTPAKKRKRQEANDIICDSKKKQAKRLNDLNSEKKKERKERNEIEKEIENQVKEIVDTKLQNTPDCHDQKYCKGCFADFLTNVTLCAAFFSFVSDKSSKVVYFMETTESIVVYVLFKKDELPHGCSRSFILKSNTRGSFERICDIEYRVGDQIVSSFVVHGWKDIKFCKNCIPIPFSSNRIENCGCLSSFLINSLRSNPCRGTSLNRKYCISFFEKINVLNLLEITGNCSSWPIFFDGEYEGVIDISDFLNGTPSDHIPIKCKSCSGVYVSENEDSCCSNCESLRRRITDRNASVEISPNLEKMICDGTNYLEKIKSFRKEFCLDDELLIMFSKCLNLNKLNHSPFLKQFLKVQFEILLSSSPQSIRWFNTPEKEAVFQFFSEIFVYTQQRGYQAVVGKKQWERNESGEYLFVGNIIGPSKESLKKVRDLFAFDAGLQKQPILLFFKHLQELKIKNAVASLSGDEIHIRKGLVRSKKNGKIVWKGMLIYDENGSLKDLVDEELEKIENSSEEEFVEGETDEMDDSNIYLKEKQEKIKLFQNKILRASAKYNGSLISRILQFSLRVSHVVDGKIMNIRMPIFYFPTAGIDHDVAHTSIIGSIQFIHNLAQEVGVEYGIGSFFIDSISFDGDPGVMKFVQEDGVVNELDTENKYSFKVGDRIIKFLPDFGHLLKCIRRDLLNDTKRMLFPVQNEQNEIEMIEVCSEHLWRLFEYENSKEGPSFSGLTISHLTAKGVLSMKQNLASDFFKKRVLDCLKVVMSRVNNKNMDMRGTLGFLTFFQKMSSVFKTKWPIQKNDYRLILIDDLLHNLAIWKKGCSAAAKELSGFTLKNIFLLKDNYRKIKNLLVGFKDLVACRGSAIVIPYEVTSTDDVENLFNLHRHYVGGGLNNSPSFSDYQRNVGKVYIMKINKSLLNHGAYKFCDCKNWTCITGDNVKFLKKLKKEKEKRSVVVESIVNFNFEWIGVEISGEMKGWSPTEEEMEQTRHFIGAVIKNVSKECEGSGELQLLNYLIENKKKRRKVTSPCMGTDDSIWKVYVMILRNYYFNAKKVEYLNSLESSEEAMIEFLFSNTSPHFWFVLHKDLNELDKDLSDIVLKKMIEKLVKFCQRRFLSVRELTGKKHLRSFRQDISSYVSTENIA